jgi:succinoglycan biosynthesis transport protein ExoP
MSIDQFASVVKARWRLGLITLLAVVLAVVGVTLQIPSRYTASASVLVDVKSPDPVAGTSVDSQMLGAHMANEVNILQSERVMLQALKDLKLLDDPKYKARWLEETHGEGDFAA